MSPRFGRVITAMVTPFDDDGALDLDGAAVLADWLVTNGSDGLVLCGTTGESPVLSDSEEIALTRAVRAAVGVPILLGTGSNDTSYAVEATRRAAELGVEGVLVVSPYYNRLCTEVPNIVGLKDAAGDPAETASFIARVPDEVEVYSGDDALTLPLLAVGAVGSISVASHWVGRQLGEMISAHEKGDVVAARRINASLIESYDFESGEEAPNPIPTKALLRVLGLPVGQCRAPMGPAPDWVEAAARGVLARLA